MMKRTDPMAFMRRILPLDVQLAWLLTGLVLTFGCGRGDGRQAVSGTIELDGQSLDRGAINFRPLTGTHGPSSGGSIDQGRFSFPARAGPLPGTYEVTIIVMKETGRLINDPQKGRVPELVQVRFDKPPPHVTVSAREKNHFEFELRTAP